MTPGIAVPVYAMRVSGTGSLPRCDLAASNLTTEFFTPDPATRYDWASSTGTGTGPRMKVVRAP